VKLTSDIAAFTIYNSSSCLTGGKVMELNYVNIKDENCGWSDENYEKVYSR
jgi:hypothetical protein